MDDIIKYLKDEISIKEDVAKEILKTRFFPANKIIEDIKLINI